MSTNDPKERDVSIISKPMVLPGPPIGSMDLNNRSEPTLFGSNPLMLALNKEMTRVAHSDHPVLIIGESGTGKTTAAQIIHHRSPRATASLVDINCAALPDALIESELFGFEKGAFTGASGRKKGLFEVAEKGTLFLDEIGELKPELQAKLLKAIEQQKIRRLGGTRDIQCDVRLLAASSRNLQRMVKVGTFREDLYYRVAVFELDIPPLRERQDDIRELIFRQLTVEQIRARRSEPMTINERALDELSSYSWPGNIRQLHNVLARLVCHADGKTINAPNVRVELDRFKQLDSDAIVLPDICSTLLPGEGLQHFSCRVRGSAIEAVKKRMNGKMSDAARRLKVDRSAIHKIVRRINMRVNLKTDCENDLAA